MISENGNHTQFLVIMWSVRMKMVFASGLDNFQQYNTIFLLTQRESMNHIAV